MKKQITPICLLLVSFFIILTAFQPLSTDEEREPVIISPEIIKPEYRGLLNEANELDVKRSVSELLELIGEPPVLIRQGARDTERSREVWVLHLYEKDSTGLYLFIKEGKVADWRLDTFMGIANHDHLLEWFQ